MNMDNTPTTTATSTNALIPTVRNLEEARTLCHNFSSVLTAGPSLREVKDFGHSDHKVVTFDDVTDERWGGTPPTFAQVKEMIAWAHGRENLLVHCHAGISRSTATAWGTAISNGHDAELALETLLENHPRVSLRRSWLIGYDNETVSHRRPFAPNELIVKHLEKLFGFKKGELIGLLPKTYDDSGF